MSECIMNKTKVLVNGNFDKAAALTVLSKNADAAWKTVISTAVTTCETKATAKKAEFDAIKMASPAAAGEKVCGPISGYLLDCVYSEVFTVRIILPQNNQVCINLNKIYSRTAQRINSHPMMSAIR